MPRKTYTMPADLDQLLRTYTYPGMVPEESKPLRQWLARYADQYDEIRFDYRVGEGEKADDQADAAVRRAIEQGTRMRVDALAWKAPDQATIVEAKEQWENAAVWQLQGYRDALIADQPSWKIRLVGVAQSATSTATELSKRAGVALYLYEFPPGFVDVTAPADEERADGI